MPTSLTVELLEAVEVANRCADRDDLDFGDLTQYFKVHSERGRPDGVWLLPDKPTGIIDDPITRRGCKREESRLRLKKFKMRIDKVNGRATPPRVTMLGPGRQEAQAIDVVETFPGVRDQRDVKDTALATTHASATSMGCAAEKACRARTQDHFRGIPSP